MDSVARMRMVVTLEKITKEPPFLRGSFCARAYAEHITRFSESSHPHSHPCFIDEKTEVQRG